MSTIDAATIAKTAKLANLKLSEHELEEYSKQLSGIISYVEKIGELDTASVTPTDHIADLYNIVREDIPGQSMNRDDIAQMAPEFENGHFVVPKIIE